MRTAYTVVRAMCQINGGGSFSIPLGSESPVPIHLKFGMFDYVHSPTSHAKYGGRCKWGGGAGISYPEKRGFSLNAPKIVFPWLVCSFGVGFPRGSNLPPFYPQEPFFNDANKAIILPGSV